MSRGVYKRTEKHKAVTKTAMNRPDVKARHKASCNTPEWIAAHSGENNTSKKPEVRAKISINNAMKRPEVVAKLKVKVNTPEHIASISGDNNVMKRPEVKLKHKASHNTEEYKMKVTGENNGIHNPGVIEKLKITQKERCGKSVMFLPNHGEIVHFRSKQEAKYARMLDALDIEWYYEHQTFKLPDMIIGCRPDFYLPTQNIWIELKNQSKDAPLDDETQNKLTTFYRVYSSCNLILLYKEDTKKLEHDLVCCEPIDIQSFGVPLKSIVEGT